MKTNFFIVVAVFSIVFSSCKKEANNPTQESTAKVEEKQNFSVAVEVVTDKNDDFPLYYTEDGTIKFDGEHAVWAGVKGQPAAQTVELNLSEEIIPTHVRLDFGIKKGEDQGDVTLKKFKMSYYGKSFEINGSDFLKYFIKNDSVQTVIDEVKGTITIKKNPKSQLNRFYYPQQSILDEIQKMTK